MEPFIHAHRQPAAAELRAMLELCHIFSPNLVEAESLVGPGAPIEVRACGS